MKKIFKVLLSFILLSLSSCNESVSEEQSLSSELDVINSELFTVHYLSFQQAVDINHSDYGEMFIALKNDNYYYVEFDFNFKDYGIDMLHSGEEIKISYTGELKQIDKNLVVENGEIKNIEIVNKANRYSFEFFNVPGADPYDPGAAGDPGEN